MERKLAAILSADVQGYSRLMGADEEGTIETLGIYMRLMATLIEQHRGRVVDYPGDNLLAEFGSVVDAVQGAISIQMELNVRNRELEPERRMEFRIGINLGDVVTEGDQIYGDGVNIAARVQTLADAGGICISGTVHEHIKNKLPLGYVSMGDQNVKNINEPIRVYRLQARSDVATSQPGTPSPSAKLSDGSPSGGTALPVATRILILAAAGSAAVVGAVILSGGQTSRTAAPGDRAALASSGTPQVDNVEPGTPRELLRGAVRARETANSPSAIGVMNFKALNPDQETAWMQDAIRDNLNGQLNRVPGLEVYSKEYIDFLVQGGDTEIKVAHELGISRMISGSYVATGEKLRIEAHVVDVQTGLLEASDFVQGEASDFFALQSQLAFKIADRLDLALSAADQATLAAAPSTSSLDAYKLLLEAEGETVGTESSREDPRDLPNRGPPDEARLQLPSLPGWAWLGPKVARAGEIQPSPEEEIRELLERYRQAYESKDLDLLGSVYAELTLKQRQARQKYFDNTQDLAVEINKVRIAVRGSEAVVSYTREDQFTDSRTGKTVKLDVRLTKMLRRVDGTWKMASAKK